MREALPVALYSTTLGSAHVGDSSRLLRSVGDASTDLVLTSPPFALTRKKEYGNEQEQAYLEWFMPFAREVKRVLKDDGSFVIDLGGAYLPGLPVRSLYQYELLVRLVREEGFYLAQEFYHYNPSRLPAPAEWVNIRRIRVKDSVNVVWWLSKTPYPKADNRKVLKAYSDSMQSLLKHGYKAKMRPSGHDISTNFSKDNGGAVTPNVLGAGAAGEPGDFLSIANTESNSAYLRRCRDAGIKAHPARFPQFFAEFFIKFLTEPDDLVIDIFAGSNTTGYVAETLKRRWLAFELSLEYLTTSSFRFEDGVDEDKSAPINFGGLFASSKKRGYDSEEA